MNQKKRITFDITQEEWEHLQELKAKWHTTQRALFRAYLAWLEENEPIGYPARETSQEGYPSSSQLERRELGE